jgi:hypothetical protein
MSSRVCVALAVSSAFLIASRRAGAADDGGRGADDRRAEKSKVQPRFSADDFAVGPFPSDLFTVADLAQNTGLRVNLTPTCGPVLPPLPTECVENEVLNELDGFHVRPRLTIAFSGSIDLSTVNSSNIFLIKLGNTLANGSPPDYAATSDDDGDEDDHRLPAGAGWVVGVDRAVWDPSPDAKDPDAKTLYVKAEEVLEQHTRYALIVTRGVHDASGHPIGQSTAFARYLDDDGDEVPGVTRAQRAHRRAYRRALRLALKAARLAAGRNPSDVAIASVFSTMSVSAVLEKVHADIRAAPVPAAADFRIGPIGPSGQRARAVFDVEAITKLSFNPQLNASQPPDPKDTQDITVRVNTLKVVPNAPRAVRQIAFAGFASRNYLKDRFMPALSTFSGVPNLQSSDTLYFVLFVPSTPRPMAGWPLVILAQGSPDTMLGGPFNQAAKLASHGFASIALNQVGLGSGSRSTVTVTRSTANGGAMTIPAQDVPIGCNQCPLPPGLGRSSDVNGDGRIDTAEGAQAGPPKGILLARHSIRQSAIDYMQLVRVIEVGVDVDGDGTADLDASRIYYAGSSNGSLVGIPFFAVEPRVRAATFTGVTGWPGLWTSPVNRGAIGVYFQNREMLNPAGTPLVTSLGGVPVGPVFFNENPPIRGAPPLVNDVPGALQIQQVEDRADWLWNSTAPGAFASYLRLRPLPGAPARPFRILESRGDQNAVNPTTAELIQAGLFADRVTLYRHDKFPSRTSFKNPHSFIIRTDQAVMRGVALAAQEHVAAFFESDGMSATDPCLTVSCPATDGPGPLFEVPASFIPDVTRDPQTGAYVNDFGFTL